MNRILNIDSSVIDEMIKISKFMQLLINEEKIDELTGLFQDISQEIILQRNDGATEIDINKATFSLDDYPELSKFIFEKYEKITEVQKIFTNRTQEFIVIKEMINSILQEDRFGTICWILTTLSMELLHNRNINKFKEFSISENLIYEVDKINAHEHLLQRFQESLNQPRIDDNGSH